MNNKESCDSTMCSRWRRVYNAHLHAESGEHYSLLHIHHLEQARFVAGDDAHVRSVRWLLQKDEGRLYEDEASAGSV